MGASRNDLVSPTDMELFLINVDGSNERQLTALGGANWAPFFHPNNRDIIFSSNHHAANFSFNLFLVRDDGSCVERVTFDPAFDAFPYFSPDGTKLIFARSAFLAIPTSNVLPSLITAACGTRRGPTRSTSSWRTGSPATAHSAATPRRLPTLPHPRPAPPARATTPPQPAPPPPSPFSPSLPHSFVSKDLRRAEP